MKVYRRFIFDNGNVIDEEIKDQTLVNDTEDIMKWESNGEFYRHIREVEKDNTKSPQSCRFYWSENDTLINLDKVILVETIKY